MAMSSDDVRPVEVRPVEVRAAGGVVTRPGAGGGVEVLVVHRPRYDDWSLPKGKAEPGEADEETAVREVEEETGYRCVLGEELETVRYEDRKGRQKQVRFWHMTVRSEEAPFEPNDEVDERRWISPAAAATLLSYDADRRLVRPLGGTDALPAAPH
jgi:8-oxo-dGTP pyrophosphatase MutT (NUDIX family)